MDPAPAPVTPPAPVPKPIWESRTFWLNVIGLLLLAAASPEIIEIIPAEARPAIAAGVAFLNILNRMMSTVSPLTLRPPPRKTTKPLAPPRVRQANPAAATRTEFDPMSPNEE